MPGACRRQLLPRMRDVSAQQRAVDHGRRQAGLARQRGAPLLQRGQVGLRGRAAVRPLKVCTHCMRARADVWEQPQVRRNMHVARHRVSHMRAVQMWHIAEGALACLVAGRTGHMPSRAAQERCTGSRAPTAAVRRALRAAPQTPALPGRGKQPVGLTHC